MPELPEVETVRRDLEAGVVGKRIVEVVATGRRTVRRHASPAELAAAVAGHLVARAERRGKYLVLRLDGGGAMVVHLGMSGQLLSVAPGAPPTPHTHVTWSFGGGPELRFVDPRTFGEVFVSTGSAASGLPVEIDHLGPDALGIDAGTLGEVLRRRSTRMKPLLLDQRAVAGIGNIYADEILWTARIHPDRPASGLTRTETVRLAEATGDVLGAAVARRGSSLADRQYRDLWGNVGGYQASHNAYGRENQPCPRCGRPIRRQRDGGRSTYFCSSCQRRKGSSPATGVRGRARHRQLG